MTERHERVWVGIDAGKDHHWAMLSTPGHRSRSGS